MSSVGILNVMYSHSYSGLYRLPAAYVSPPESICCSPNLEHSVVTRAQSRAAALRISFQLISDCLLSNLYSIIVCLHQCSTFKFDTCIPQAEADAHSRAVFAQVRFSGGARARGAVRARGAAGRARARASHATLVRRHYRHRTPLPSRSLTPSRAAAWLPACVHELHQYLMHFNLSHIPITLKVHRRWSHVLLDALPSDDSFGLCRTELTLAMTMAMTMTLAMTRPLAFITLKHTDPHSQSTVMKSGCHARESNSRASD